MNCDLTGFLYADSSFLEGMGHILDIGATMDDYNYVPNGYLADLIALGADSLVTESEIHSALLRNLHQLPPKEQARLLEYA